MMSLKSKPRLSALQRALLLCPFVLLLASCQALRPHEQPWQDDKTEVVKRVEAAKAAEGRYARRIEQNLKQMLAVLLPAEAVEVHVYLQLDFDQNRQLEQLAPEEQRLLEQSSTQQQAGQESSESSRFQPTWVQSHLIYHPGRIQQLGIVVLINQDQIGSWDARELSERLYKLVIAGSPFREERGDRLEVQVMPFAPKL
jgi:flagellar biosynthesis/type III secretory pathway M-ring protein FliF/YscJ